jgi:hypothetical protein
MSPIGETTVIDGRGAGLVVSHALLVETKATINIATKPTLKPTLIRFFIFFLFC